jgi:hypothetical protein
MNTTYKVISWPWPPAVHAEYGDICLVAQTGCEMQVLLVKILPEVAKLGDAEVDVSDPRAELISIASVLNDEGEDPEAIEYRKHLIQVIAAERAWQLSRNKRSQECN